VNDSKLYEAAKNARFTELKKLLEEDPTRINTMDFMTGNTALHAACMSKSLEMIQYEFLMFD
jgi:hypothetical protein